MLALVKKKYLLNTFLRQMLDYSDPGFYFVTFNMKRQDVLLAVPEHEDLVLTDAGEIVMQYWKDLPVKYPLLVLDAVIVMPDHVHAVIEIKPDPEREEKTSFINALKMSKLQRRQMLLSKAMGFWKMKSAKDINVLQGTTGQAFWQTKYHVSEIENLDGYFKVRAYIENNPKVFLEKYYKGFK